MELIYKYFPSLSDYQYKQLEKLYSLYSDWNSKINVISRKDIENLYLHHILHSMAIAHEFDFAEGTMIADLGTGGGFPGIPLAIMNPNSHFVLIDSIGKKLTVAKDIADKIGLNNVECRHERAEEDKDKYEFIVSRAVMPLPDLCSIGNKLIDRKLQRNAHPNGIICLKGGDLTNELSSYKKSADIIEISRLFNEEFFKDKKIVYVQI